MHSKYLQTSTEINPHLRTQESATMTSKEVRIQEEVAQLTAADADLMEESRLSENASSEQVERPANSSPTSSIEFVPLRMGGNGGTHKVSEGSARLIEEEVTLDDLKRMTGLFYEKAFQDETLDKFIRSHADPHGDRFAKWIHQKLSGSNVWDQDRRERSKEPVQLAGGYRHIVHDRSSAHVAAWHSPKRPAQESGRHFQLDECRVWMRLHFWAMREAGLMESAPAFCDYYVRFIGHFVRVYESTAPAFARDSLRWSEDPSNITKYLADGRRMTDVLGLTMDEAEDQIPEHEANDFEWPYNQAPQSQDVSGR